MVKVLALDAMGVIYKAGDDVAELLVPFVQQHSDVAEVKIKKLYNQCSLGVFSSSVFWTQLGLSPNVEDEYLSQHLLVPGVRKFIVEARRSFDAVWCLSNDVSEWSIKLRDMFALVELFDGFVISGDVNIRKPSLEIYKVFCERTCSRPEEVLFIDDRPNNVAAAIDSGMKSILFGEQSDPIQNLRCAKDYSALETMVLKSDNEGES